MVVVLILMMFKVLIKVVTLILWIHWRYFFSHTDRQPSSPSVIVLGGGILGIATARALRVASFKNKEVTEDIQKVAAAKLLKVCPAINSSSVPGVLIPESMIRNFRRIKFIQLI